jgi:anti-sigma factor RsiW
MKSCNEIQFDLPVYFDGVLISDEREIVDSHLAACPLCRKRLSEIEGLRGSLRGFARPEIPQSLTASIRASLAERLQPATGTPGFRLIEARSNWMEIWLMPYTVGGLATLIVGFTMLWVMLFATRVPLNSELAAASTAGTSNSSILIARSLPAGAVSIDLSPGEYATSRAAVSGESPSLNPRGALVALTKSLVRGEMKDDEVVVVADVFGNGLASISEVVEPSHDRRAIEELQKALQSDPAFAPFVPASLDQRSETMRVIFKIQNVNVYTRLNAKPNKRS